MRGFVRPPLPPLDFPIVTWVYAHNVLVLVKRVVTNLKWVSDWRRTIRGWMRWMLIVHSPCKFKVYRLHYQLYLITWRGEPWFYSAYDFIEHPSLNTSRHCPRPIGRSVGITVDRNEFNIIIRYIIRVDQIYCLFFYDSTLLCKSIKTSVCIVRADRSSIKNDKFRLYVIIIRTQFSWLHHLISV